MGDETHADDAQSSKELTKDEIELFEILRKNYFKTARELLQICVDHDNYLNHKDADNDNLAVKNVGTKLAKKLSKVRFEKLGLGSLMRIVRSKRYENLTDDLSEV